MSAKQSDKSSKEKATKRIPRRYFDLLLLVFGLVLGFCFGFLSDHVRNVVNYWISMLDNRIRHRCCLLQLNIYNHCEYWKASWRGMVIEVVVIIVILIVLWWFYRRHGYDDSKVEEEIKGLRKDVNMMGSNVVSAIDRLGNKIDGLGTRIGGVNATTESQTNKGQTGKTKKEDKEKGRKA